MTIRHNKAIIVLVPIIPNCQRYTAAAVVFELGILAVDFVPSLLIEFVVTVVFYAIRFALRSRSRWIELEVRSRDRHVLAVVLNGLIILIHHIYWISRAQALIFRIDSR